ncbi:Hypothetical protein POVN_LOCUS622 [uncultured virus]|nr:Hypothetical protein POVN_LOCUS622 [uncultured virus]
MATSFQSLNDFTQRIDRLQRTNNTEEAQNLIDYLNQGGLVSMQQGLLDYLQAYIDKPLPLPPKPVSPLRSALTRAMTPVRDALLQASPTFQQAISEALPPIQQAFQQAYQPFKEALAQGYAQARLPGRLLGNGSPASPLLGAAAATPLLLAATSPRSPLVTPSVRAGSILPPASPRRSATLSAAQTGSILPPPVSSLRVVSPVSAVEQTVPITVSVPSGQVYSVNIRPSASVGQVKELLQSSLQIPVGSQVLTAQTPRGSVVLGNGETGWQAGQEVALNA